MTLTDRVLRQIEEDIEFGDFTALEELLNNIPVEYLISYLPEEEGAMLIEEGKNIYEAAPRESPRL